MYIIIGIKYNLEFCIFGILLCLRFRGIIFIIWYMFLNKKLVKDCVLIMIFVVLIDFVFNFISLSIVDID